MILQRREEGLMQRVGLATLAGMGVLLAGCSISVPQPAENATVTGAAAVVVTANATYTGLTVDVDGRDHSASMVANGPQRHEGTFMVPVGSARMTVSADVYCWYCTGRTTHSVVTRNFTVVANLFTTVSAGGSHTCAIDTGQRLFCWGDNALGQLGSGMVPDVACPTNTQPAARCQPNGVIVSGGQTWKQVSAGQAHTCGLTTGDAVMCWGSNQWGQLGNGGVVDSRVPVPVGINPTAMLPFRAVTAGANHSCALDAGNRLYCWGDDREFQLGVAGLTACPTGSAGSCSTSPVRQGEYTGGASYIFTEASGGERHTCASNGQWIKCWGRNVDGQLGQGTQGAASGGPSGNPSVPGTYLAGVSAGGSHSCAVRATTTGTTADCWGDNRSGQLGGGWPASVYDTPQPVARPGGTSGDITGVTAGGQHSCALFVPVAPGSVRVPVCAGLNNQGQLGQGPAAVNSQPHRTLVPVALSAADLGADFFQVSAGASHTCALKLVTTQSSTVTAGAVLCWGNNSHGQVGQNYQQIWDRPTNVRGP